MSDTHRREAAELGKRASIQGKHAAQNAGRAARAAAQPVLEEVQDMTEKVEDVAEETVKTAKRVSPLALSRLSSNTGQGFLALSVALYAAGFAISKFKGVYMGHSQVLNAVTKTAEHISNDSAA